MATLDSIDPYSCKRGGFHGLIRLQKEGDDLNRGISWTHTDVKRGGLDVQQMHGHKKEDAMNLKPWHTLVLVVVVVLVGCSPDVSGAPVEQSPVPEASTFGEEWLVFDGETDLECTERVLREHGLPPLSAFPEEIHVGCWDYMWNYMDFDLMHEMYEDYSVPDYPEDYRDYDGRSWP